MSNIESVIMRKIRCPSCKVEFSVRSTRIFCCSCGKSTLIGIDPNDYSKLLIQGESNTFKVICGIQGCKKAFKNRHSMKKHKLEAHSY